MTAASAEGPLVVAGLNSGLGVDFMAEIDRGQSGLQAGGQPGSSSYQRIRPDLLLGSSGRSSLPGSNNWPGSAGDGNREAMLARRSGGSAQSGRSAGGVILVTEVGQPEAPAGPEPIRLCANEVRRRIWHISPGLLALILPLIPHPDPLPVRALIELFALASLLTISVLATYQAIARPGERYWVLNVVSYPATIILTLILFPGHPEFAAVVLVTIALGDGSATVSGLLWPRWPLPWNRSKTWVGTATFLLVAGPIATLAYWLESRPPVHIALAAACVFTAVTIAAVAESLAVKISDNLRVGLTAAVGIVVAHWLSIGF